MYLYVLKLEEERYYVGIAEDIGLRLWQHLKMGDKTGAAWTKKYKPLKVIHLSEIFPKKKSRYKEIENQCVLRIAKKVGFHNVRGGGFCVSNDDYPDSWNKKLFNIPPADFSRMKPPSKQELDVLLKGKYELWLSTRKMKRRAKS